MQKGQQNQEKLDQKLIWYFGCLRDPQTHPGAKKTPQMACESQIWPRCTPRGITSLFRTKELIFKTDRSKLSHFTRNYPLGSFLVWDYSTAQLNQTEIYLSSSMISLFASFIFSLLSSSKIYLLASIIFSSSKPPWEGSQNLSRFCCVVFC